MAMQRPIQRAVVDHSLPVKPCALYLSADSQTFPRIMIDPRDKEQPCTRLAEDEIPESLAMGFVGVGVCAYLLYFFIVNKPKNTAIKTKAVDTWTLVNKPQRSTILFFI